MFGNWLRFQVNDFSSLILFFPSTISFSISYSSNLSFPSSVFQETNSFWSDNEMAFILFSSSFLSSFFFFFLSFSLCHHSLLFSFFISFQTPCPIKEGGPTKEGGLWLLVVVDPCWWWGGGNGDGWLVTTLGPKGLYPAWQAAATAAMWKAAAVEKGPRVARRIFSISASFNLFSFARRFWNQIFTWVSVRFKEEENSARSAIERYCLVRNFFSNESNWDVVKGVLGLRFDLCFRRVHFTAGRGWWWWGCPGGPKDPGLGGPKDGKADEGCPNGWCPSCTGWGSESNIRGCVNRMSTSEFNWLLLLSWCIDIGGSLKLSPCPIPPPFVLLDPFIVVCWLLDSLLLVSLSRNLEIPKESLVVLCMAGSGRGDDDRSRETFSGVVARSLDRFEVTETSELTLLRESDRSGSSCLEFILAKMLLCLVDRWISRVWNIFFGLSLTEKFQNYSWAFHSCYWKESEKITRRKKKEVMMVFWLVSLSVTLKNQRRENKLYP